MTSKGAVTKLIADLGPVCAAYMDQAFHDLPCKYLEIDEIWAFCYAKQKNVPESKRGVFGFGDVWTFTAIDADTKLIPSYMVGARDLGTATEFMQDLAGPSRGPGANHDGRPQGLSERRSGCLRRRGGLRAASMPPFIVHATAIILTMSPVSLSLTAFRR